MKSPSDNEPVEVEVAEGKHTLEITKGGFRTFAREFEITSGGEEVIRVTLVPLEKEIAAKATSPPVSQPVAKVDEEAGEMDAVADAAAKKHVTLPNGWSFGEPVNLGPTVNARFSALSPALSFDGLTLFFASDRPAGRVTMIFGCLLDSRQMIPLASQSILVRPSIVVFTTAIQSYHLTA